MTNNICEAYLDPEAGNPLSPLPPKRQSRLISLTDPKFLDYSIEMVEDRCTRCHRYKKNAPSPDVSHVGSKGESQCKLDHYPAPCDYIEEDGRVCEHTEETQTDQTNVKEQEESSHRAEMQGKLDNQSQQMDQLKSELAEMKRMVMAQRSPPTSHGSLAPATTATSLQSQTYTTQSITSSISSPATTLPSQSIPGAAGAAGGGIMSDANKLLQLNLQSEDSRADLGGYGGPSMKDLQRDNSIAEEVQRQMNLLISGNPCLQKVVAGQTTAQKTQMRVPHQPTVPSHVPDTTHLAYQAIQAGSDGARGQAQAGPSDHLPNILDMDSLLGLTVREKQYRPHEFASRGNFYYARNINERNITLPLYVFGYLKHCVILQSGLVPVAEGELMARLVNLMNICEIASNNSTLNDFDHVSWQMARAYGDRVFNDMEHGLRAWSELPTHVLPDVFLHARDLVDVQSKKRQDKGEGTRGRGRGRGGRGAGNPGKQATRSGSEGEKQVCSSYNDFYTGNGCAYEHNNNRRCSYEHHCSKCFAANGTKEGHKARFCTGTPTTPTTTSG